MGKYKFRYSVLISLFLLSTLYTKAYDIDNNNNGIKIVFSHHIGDLLLELDSASYKNKFNQDFTVTKFKYYIGKISFTTISGKSYVHDKYFLVDEEKQESKTIYIDNIPNEEFAYMSFVIGVDSTHNCSGAQSGSLDPINGMFWTWNTGYIFMKLEGVSEFSTSPNAMFEYHIGGYKSPNNNIRSVVLPLKNTIVMSGDATVTVTVKADISEILKSPVDIDFSKLSSVTDMNNATMIADNYSDMFSVYNIVSE